MPPRRKDPEIGRLAERLIARHLRVSIPDPAQRHSILRDSTDDLHEQNIRAVAVVGAGASAPLLGRGQALAEALEKRFPEDEATRAAELFRLERVYGLKRDDFETRLAALSRTPETTRVVRKMIAENYNYRHPTILGYELLAHLLKHRFLDAIITFNFDELLDQSLDDELGVGGYRRIVSDRDAADAVPDPDDAAYLPLYIKLHGTASEPESLRFTREAYYQLPQQMVGVVEELLESQLSVIVNVGSAMTGFDLHRLLRVPMKLEVYDLSYTALAKPVREAIAKERAQPLDDSYDSATPREKPSFSLPPDGTANSDGWMKRLAAEIAQRSGSHAGKRPAGNVVFRSAERHEAIAELLGADAVVSRWRDEPKRRRRDYVDYLRQRTIIELAFSAAKARGLAQLSWLATDRSGTYFDLYRREARAANVKPLTWSDLRMAAGLIENSWLPDVVQAAPELAGKKPEAVADEGPWSLREFVPKELAAHVLRHLGNATPARKRRLTRALQELQGGSEVEIQPTDDRVCAKAFRDPVALPTVTSLRTFTLSLFRDVAPEDEVYISCESGEWLLEDGAMHEVLSKQQHVEVITAFELKYGKLDDLYGDRLKHQSIDPWRHNRHMTIVCRRSTPWRAVYFARRLRTPLITPVYLKDPDDAARLKRSFDLMRYEIEAAAARKSAFDRRSDLLDDDAPPAEEREAS
jgi:hypothetical protein